MSFPRSPAPLLPMTYLYDPETEDTAARAIERHTAGWMGSYPATPCVYCGCEVFRWNGDWSMGYQCFKCRKTWREDHRERVQDSGPTAG